MKTIIILIVTEIIVVYLYKFKNVIIGCLVLKGLFKECKELT